MGSDGGDLFTGQDDAQSTGEVVDNSQPPLDRGDSVGIQAWLSDLTYDEVHAFTVGFAPMYVGLALLTFTPWIGTGLLGVSFALTVTATTEKHAPTKTLGYIIREVHYFLGGQTVAALLGTLTAGLLAVLGAVGTLLLTVIP